MKIKELKENIRSSSAVELKDQLKLISEQLVKLRCKSAVDPIKQSHLFESLRRSRARLKTELMARLAMATE